MGLLSYRSRFAENPIEEDDRLAEKLAKQGRKIIKLNRGDPAIYFKTPQYIIDAYKKALQLRHTGYGNPLGIRELREQVAARYQRMYGLSPDPDRIIVSQGISEALLMLNLSLINEGDRAVLFKPYFSIYATYLRLFGGKPVLERYDENNYWNVDTASLERNLKQVKGSAKPKYLLFTNPNNPTGTVLQKNILKEIVELANEHNLLLISDEIYDELVFNKAHFTSICDVAEGVPYAILNGASKNLDSPGFRIGFVIVPGEDKKAAELRRGLGNFVMTRLSANTPAQYAIAEGLRNWKKHRKAVSSMAKEIEKRVNFATKLINEGDYMHTVRPNGAFYIFPKIRFDRLRIRNDAAFVERLLLEENVQVVRGSGFGEPSHIRLVSLATKDILELAVNRINNFCRRNAK